MSKKETYICSDCLFIGSPSISVGRLFVEFIVNLIFFGFSPVFSKVRHCPDCGRHSMVLVESEAGQEAMKKHQDQGRGGITAETSRTTNQAKAEEEYTKLRMQR
jgi:hypothetical protein